MKIEKVGLVAAKVDIIVVKTAVELVVQFKTDDYVVHPIYGVGHIVQIEEKEFSEKEVRQYYKVVLSRSTIWIPVGAEEIVGLRSVTDESDLDQYRDLLKDTPVPLENVKAQQRHLDLAKRLREGSFRIMCEVVRDLTASSQKKALGVTDRTTLQKTRDKLYQEWATATGISVVEVMNEINSLLTVTPQESLE